MRGERIATGDFENRVQMPCRDYVVAFGRLVDAIDMEVIPGRLERAFAVGFTSPVRDVGGDVQEDFCVPDFEVVEAAPAEQFLPGHDIDFLEAAVKDKAILRSGVWCEVEGAQLVDGLQEGAAAGEDVEFVRVWVG